MDNLKIIIPARRNSKGLPFKNRILFDNTINIIPKSVIQNNLIVTTDDEELIKKSLDYGVYSVVERNENLSLDTTSTKDVIVDLLNIKEINEDDTIIMLYLTYPERTWEDVLNAFNFFRSKSAKSLLCKKEINTTHPYLYMLENSDYMGEQLIKHDLYRRQDYPKVFEISHYISIFNVGELFNLNNNLYNQNTLFYPINNKIDVDTNIDLDKFINQNKNG